MTEKIMPLPVKKNKFGQRVKDLDTTTYYRQIAEEVLEAHEAAVAYDTAVEVGKLLEYSGNIEDEMFELVDIITCCITRLEIIGCDEEARQELYQAVNDKNLKRGYFDD